MRSYDLTLAAEEDFARHLALYLATASLRKAHYCQRCHTVVSKPRNASKTRPEGRAKICSERVLSGRRCQLVDLSFVDRGVEAAIGTEHQRPEPRAFHGQGHLGDILDRDLAILGPQLDHVDPLTEGGAAKADPHQPDNHRAIPFAPVFAAQELGRGRAL